MVDFFSFIFHLVTSHQLHQRLVRLITPFDVWGLPPQSDIDPKEDIPDYIYSEEEVSRKKSIVPDHDLTHAMTVSISFYFFPFSLTNSKL